jgi:hypothetical protein
MPPCPRTGPVSEPRGTFGTVSPNNRTSGSERPIKRAWVSGGSSGALIDRRAVRGGRHVARHGEARAWECIPTTLSIGAGLWRSQMDALGRRAQARGQNPPPADHPAVIVRRPEF